MPPHFSQRFGMELTCVVMPFNVNVAFREWELGVAVEGLNSSSHTPGGIMRSRGRNNNNNMGDT